jgi:hypothetical protein
LPPRQREGAALIYVVDSEEEGVEEYGSKLVDDELVEA